MPVILTTEEEREAGRAADDPDMERLLRIREKR
jgi:hypothetical protein